MKIKEFGLFYSVMKALGRPLCHLLFWPILRGLERVPAQGPGIFAGNHLGAGESFLLLILVPPEVTFPGKRELFRTDTLWHRFAAWFLRRMHQVPMDRAGGDASADALGSIYQVLDDGGFVAIFPEGHRSPDGRLYKGRTGVARLALTTGAPVIPFGCFRTRFTRRWLPFPWLFRPELRFGEPFSFPDQMRRAFLEAPDRESAGLVLRAATDQVMDQIQAITGQEQVGEYSYRPIHPGPSAPAVEPGENPATGRSDDPTPPVG